MAWLSRTRACSLVRRTGGRASEEGTSNDRPLFFFPIDYGPSSCWLGGRFTATHFTILMASVKRDEREKRKKRERERGGGAGMGVKKGEREKRKEKVRQRKDQKHRTQRPDDQLVKRLVACTNWVASDDYFNLALAGPVHWKLTETVWSWWIPSFLFRSDSFTQLARNMWYDGILVL